jgi:hypothetical protein
LPPFEQPKKKEKKEGRKGRRAEIWRKGEGQWWCDVFPMPFQWAIKNARNLTPEFVLKKNPRNCQV